MKAVKYLQTAINSKYHTLLNQPPCKSLFSVKSLSPRSLISQKTIELSVRTPERPSPNEGFVHTSIQEGLGGSANTDTEKQIEASTQRASGINVMKSLLHVALISR